MPRPTARVRPTPLPATRALREFLATEAAGGVVLLVAAVVALGWANSPWGHTYELLWRTEVGFHAGRHRLDLDLRHWVNEGLMAIFFLVVALEVKRELLLGELAGRRHATLPIVAAIGGMVLPAVLYAAFNLSTGGSSGWGVPMATDIAFAIGVLAVVAPGLPSAVRLFLLTLAIVDDIGAIVIIAVFYSSGISWVWLAVALAVLAVVAVLRGFGFSATALFVALGICLWLALHASGVHATLAGVTMGLMVPAAPALTREIVRTRGGELVDVFTPQAARETTRIARQAVSQLEWLEHGIHPWSSLVIVPVFALANAGVSLGAESLRGAVTSPVTLGIVVGLLVGKTVGISGAAWLACKAGIADLPDDVRWRQIVGVAALGGIGFTVSLFIAGLAFSDAALVDQAKVGILAASVLATIVGTMLLRPTRGEDPPA